MNTPGKNMTTPTPEQARKCANGMVPNSTVATMLRSLAEQVEVMTAERDALKDAARLALGSLELIRSQVKAWGHGDAAIAALKAVL